MPKAAAEKKEKAPKEPKAKKEKAPKEPKTTKGKKDKDPNAPKKPLTAYMLFCNEKRPDVKKEHPDLKLGEVSQKLAALWGGMTEDDKKPYHDQAGEAKEKYAELMKDYKPAAGTGKATKAKAAPKKKAKKAESEDEEDDDGDDAAEDEAGDDKGGDDEPEEEEDE